MQPSRGQLAVAGAPEVRLAMDAPRRARILLRANYCQPLIDELVGIAQALDDLQDFEQVLAEGEGDGFGPVGDAELCEERGRVFLHHVEADAQLRCDVDI